jgi:hypothetical protein
MISTPFQAGLVGLLIVVAISFVARLTFLDGSLFSPDAAPGIGPLALGDLLAIAAFAVGYIIGELKRRN